MDALALFRLEHARAHSAAVAPEGGPLWLEDAVTGDLTEDQLRFRPGGGANSLAWLLWHTARIEDMAVNVVLAGRAQVLDDGWSARLGVSRRDMGSGMADVEVGDLSERVDLTALRAYRGAVGLRTREVAAALGAESLAAPVSERDVARAAEAGAFGDRAAWLRTFWEGRPRAWLLSWTAAGHSYLHFGEAMALRGQAGIGGGR
jgi:hypothetical protein